MAEKKLKFNFVGDTLVIQAMKRVMSFMFESVVVERAEANFVVAESIKDIEAGFSKNKRYIIITVEHLRGSVPDNVKVFVAPFELVDVKRFISEAVETNIDDEPDWTKEVPPSTPLCSDAKHILVIDDSPRNLISAKQLLAGHKLVVAEGYEQAMEILSRKQFDVVLTDLYLPMSSNMLSSEAFKLGELVPYGFLLMCEAARKGAGHVAIVTDGNHHADCFSAAFDHFSKFCLTIERAKVMMLFAKLNNDGSKDWREALNRLLPK